jgi:hypothetical protein
MNRATLCLSRGSGELLPRRSAGLHRAGNPPRARTVATQSRGRLEVS